mmetsp:Transcript_13701/g.38953  ORF Transcript_13701/g.38953 Transcript_13701/m.38953 type:complete len:298 (-) Transcript_13701:1226-2119(-)
MYQDIGSSSSSDEEGKKIEETYGGEAGPSTAPHAPPYSAGGEPIGVPPGNYAPTGGPAGYPPPHGAMDNPPSNAPPGYPTYDYGAPPQAAGPPGYVPPSGAYPPQGVPTGYASQDVTANYPPQGVTAEYPPQGVYGPDQGKEQWAKSPYEDSDFNPSPKFATANEKTPLYPPPPDAAGVAAAGSATAAATGADGHRDHGATPRRNLRNCTSDGQRLYPRPTHVVCPYCGYEGVTDCHLHQPSPAQWAFCGGLFCAGCIFWPLWFVCCVPCCISELADATHRCANPECRRTLGETRVL